MSRSKIETAVLEPLFTVRQIKEQQFIPLSTDSIRRMFKDEPGVVKFGHGDRKNKRTYVTLLIPKSVLERKLAEMKKVPR